MADNDDLPKSESTEETQEERSGQQELTTEGTNPPTTENTQSGPDSITGAESSAGTGSINGNGNRDRCGRGFARFLYNQNPFYLISCLLVIYGCQNLARSNGSLTEKALWMTGGIAAYTMLMVLVCIAVVRLAKVWDDARSIFIVVVISFVALTTGFDEVCLQNPSLAWALSTGVFGLIIVATETVLRCCRIRLNLWYRLFFYAQFFVLMMFPIVLGDAVRSRNDVLANWGAVLFSWSVGAGVLLLVPAVRKGDQSINDNGTPWSYPLFPFSAIVVLLVLAAIRSHAIWMSFGFHGTAEVLEAFLVLPILASVIVLFVESSIASKNYSLMSALLWATPLLLLCGLSQDGFTHLPIGTELRMYLGSSWTVCLATVLVLYLYMGWRRVPYADFAVPLVLFVGSVSAPLPTVAVDWGLEPAMVSAAANVMLLWITLRNFHMVWLWVAATASAAATILMIGRSLGLQTEALLTAYVFSVLAMLLIGALSDSDLATTLRYLAGLGMSFGMAMLMFYWAKYPDVLCLVIGVMMVLMAFGYAFVVLKKGWFLVSMINLAFLLVTVGYQSHTRGDLTEVNWPIASGLASLAIGGGITTKKTGALRKVVRRRWRRWIWRKFEGGL